MNREHYLSKRIQSPPEADQQVETKNKKAEAAKPASPVESAEIQPTKTKVAGSTKPEVQTSR